MSLLSRNGTEFPDLEVIFGAGTRYVAPSSPLRYDEIVNGGMDTMTFDIPESERAAYSGWNTNLAKIRLAVHRSETAAMIPGGIVWEGNVWKVGPADNGKCKVYCVGGKYRMEHTYKDIMFRVDGVGDWSERDDEDANCFHNHENYSIAVEKSKLKWTANNAPYGYSNSAGFAIVAPGVKLRRIDWTMEKNADHGNFAMRVRTFTGPLPDGPENGKVAQMTQVGPLLDMGPANPDGTRFSAVYQTVANRMTAKNALNLDVMCQEPNGLTMANPREFWAKRIWVYDRADTDDYYSTQVMQTIASLMKYNRAKIVDFTAPKVLPLFHHRSESIDGLADLMATFQQAFWLVGLRNPTLTGDEELIFTTWGGTYTTTWYTTMAEIRGHSIEPTKDLINAQRVYYKTLSGRQKNVAVYADGQNGRPTDPFYGSNPFWIANQSLYEGSLSEPTPAAPSYYGAYYTPIWGEPIDLPDRQPDETLARYVGDLAIKELAVDRGQGTIRLLSAREGSAGGTEKPACFIRAGDQLVVTDFDGAGAGGVPGPRTFRIYQKQGGDTGVDLVVDRKPASVARFLARREKRMQRMGTA